VCEPCGTCYDNICNNNEDCLSGATSTPDCGGDCKQCEYKKESCYDRICNNNEDCTKNLTTIPDCGGNCRECAASEKPLGERNLFWFWLLISLVILLLIYSLKKSYTHLKKNVRKKQILEYERKLLLQTKITQSLLDDLEKVERMLLTEPIEKVIILFVTLIRRFFKELFSLKYEFTYEELKKEIESTKISQTFKKVLFRFFDRGLEIEYSGKNVSKEEMLAMISEFKAILGLTSEEPVKSKEIVKDDKRISGTELIFALIRDAESSIMEGDLATALELYNNISAKFHGLNYEDKKKIHSFIVRLYEEIKAAKEKLN
jgi:hypothetical protein